MRMKCPTHPISATLCQGWVDGKGETKEMGILEEKKKKYARQIKNKKYINLVLLVLLSFQNCLVAIIKEQIHQKPINLNI